MLMKTDDGERERPEAQWPTAGTSVMPWQKD
jgi:hypothetical protein